MSMNVNGAGKDPSVELALTNLGTAGAGKSAGEIKDTALGPVLSGNGVTVVLPSDLQLMLEKMGIEHDDQRRDLLQCKLASALTMMLAGMQIFNEQQQAVLEGIAKCEEEIDRIKGGTNVLAESEALAGLDLSLDPEIIAIQIEIQKLDQMIESLKQTPEEKRTEEQKQKLAKYEQEKADQEKALKAKSDEKLINAIKAKEAGLFAQLSSDCVSALFSVLATVAALARKELAENSDVTDLTKMLDGAQQLAIALGAERSDELAEFNAMMEQLNAKRVTMA